MSWKVRDFFFLLQISRNVIKLNRFSLRFLSLLFVFQSFCCQSLLLCIFFHFGVFPLHLILLVFVYCLDVIHGRLGESLPVLAAALLGFQHGAQLHLVDLHVERRGGRHRGGTLAACAALKPQGDTRFIYIPVGARTLAGDAGGAGELTEMLMARGRRPVRIQGWTWLSSFFCSSVKRGWCFCRFLRASRSSCSTVSMFLFITQQGEDYLFIYSF